MEKLTDAEIKKIILDILIYIDKFCQENEIEYFINYGTLLGAIRHKGFIPWDDDIDITMTRPNYEKFMKLYKEDTSKYKMISLETEEKYFNNFIKIHDTSTLIEYSNLDIHYKSGVFIDIFPLDYFADKKIIDSAYYLEKLKWLSLAKKENISNTNGVVKRILRTTAWIIVRLLTPRFFALKIEKLIKKYTSSNPTFAAFIISKNRERDILPLETGKELIKLEFEGREFYAPSNYEAILSHVYGDYMQLPPEDQQIAHSIDAYRVEE